VPRNGAQAQHIDVTAAMDDDPVNPTDMLENVFDEI
jgi:hypothetical protein